jgi:glycerophosphoryl diester phosphodiesterase
LELDVHGTHDGAVVVFHDPTLERTTNGSGPLQDLALDALQRLDAGYHFSHDGAYFPYRGQGVRISTLQEVLRAFPDQRLNIEIKQATPPLVDAVLDLFRETNAWDRCLLAAEHDDIMLAIRAAVGHRVATSMSTADVVDFMNRFAQGDWGGYAPAARALQIPVSFEGLDLITADTVAAAHRLGLEIHAWTINDPTEMKRLVALGVDGIISDLPGLALSVLRAP